MPTLIDTHSHIDGDEFLEDIQEIITRAQDANVRKILIPNINTKTIGRILEICSNNPGMLYPMIGLHPEDVKENYKELLATLKNILDKHNNADSEAQRFIAIGEIGIDLYWDKTFEKEQIEAFERQIEWSIEYKLPVMIHTRNAHKEVISIIQKYKDENIKGVFHCFAGNIDEAEDLLSFNNFMLGIGGIVTFKKSTLPETLKRAVPLSRIVLETDAPYMAPVPYRGKRNESSFIPEIANKIAEIYNCSLDEVALQTTKNASFVFDL